MEKFCQFCQENIKSVGYKDTDILGRFLTHQAKIMPSRRSGMCKKHQKLLSQAVKRARFMALLPFTSR